MKAKCIVPGNSYSSVLKKGEEYKITDIQDSIFRGDYYVIGVGEYDKGFTCHLYRFDITKEFAEAYVVKHHSDWRKENDENQSRPS